MNNVNKQRLLRILKSQKDKYENEWESVQDSVFRAFEDFKKKVFVFNEITLDDIKKWRTTLPPQIMGMFRYLIVNDKFGRELLSAKSMSKLREFLRQLESTNDLESCLELFVETVNDKDIKGAKVSVISTWFTIFKPQFFFPIWGISWEGATITSRLQTETGIDIGDLLNHPENAAKFIRIMNEISQELGISNMVESAYYLSRYTSERNNNDAFKKVPAKENLLLSLTSQGYLYPPHLVSQFYTALKTKGFVILSGLTGTGKTKIAQELAELLDDSGSNFLFLAVRPDWRDSKALLGYYNPLTGEYYKTKLLDFILEAKRDYEQNRGNAKPYFVLLDEMNLAHVEYYFADFLSVLESGREEEGEYKGFTREAIPLHDSDWIEAFEGIPKKLRLPPNLYIIGTVNIDETTYAFSPKVLDRAFVVEFHDVDLRNYPPETGEPLLEAMENLGQIILKDLRGPKGKFLARSKDEINEAVREFKSEHPDYWNILVNLNKALEPYDMHFGYRVVDEIALFFKSAKESKKAGIVEFEGDDEIFDLALLMKVLPKFHGNRKRLEKPLLITLQLAKEGKLEGDEYKLEEEELFKRIFGENTTRGPKAVINEFEKIDHYHFKHTAKKVLRMLRQLYEIGFASFS